jgi:ATP-dependent helicase/nuclease subunit A
VTFLRDQPQRDRIRTALDENQLVLAGAGAGKTYALVDRMVSAVRTGTPVEQMAAITFTRKAAGEMRGRFQKRLRREAEEATGPDHDRLAAARANADRCFIGTIHAFCGRLLRERPTEAGVPPDFKEVEPREAAELRRDAWDAFVQAQYTAGDDRIDRLEELGLRPEDLFHFFVQRNAYREVPLKSTTTPRPDLDTAVEHVHALMDGIEALIPANPSKGRDPLMTTWHQARHFVDHHGLRRDADRVRLLRMWAGPPSVKVTYWDAARADATTLRDERLPAFDETVLQPVLQQWRQHVYAHTTEFVDAAVAFYRARRLAQGQVTFQDLLLQAAALLRDHPGVRRAFQQRYQRLFVDEFQDTDPIQARVLFYLTGTHVTERDWRALQPQPGRLFLVGDAKQSIYRFRRADLDTFRFVGERIEATGGTILQLNTSFRSLGAFCDWANEAFEPVFDAYETPYQADFAPLFKHRPDGADAQCVRTLTTDKVYRNRRSDIVQTEAERIAQFIAAACAGDTAFNGEGPNALLPLAATPGDFMILTRDKRPLTGYAEALEAHGLPYDLVGGGALGGAEEVQAFVEMLEVIHAPENPVRLVGHLRGLLVGLGDDELRAFKEAGGTFDYQTSVPESIDEPTRGRIQQAFERLRAADADLQTYAPGVAIECMLDRLRLIPFAATRPLGSSRAGNLLRLQALVQQWTTQGWHWGTIVAELCALVEDPGYDIEEMTLDVERTDVVRIMNVHQAKGLQAPVVFLADPYSAQRGTHDPTLHVTREGDASYLSLPVRRPRGDHHTEIIAEPEGWDADAEEEARYLAAEEDRLLYVAATRARNLLVVSQYAPKRDNGPWSNLAPALEGVPELSTYEERRPAEPSDEPSDEPKQAPAPRMASACWETVRRPSFEQVNRASPFPALPELSSRDDLMRHAVLCAVRGEQRDALGRYLRGLVAESDALTASDAEAALDAVSQFQRSPMWDNLRQADPVYTDVPLCLSKQTNGTNRLVRDQVDLIYSDKQGWHLVVFVTRAAPASSVAWRKGHLNALADRWEEMGGRPIASQTLWGLDDGRDAR